MKKTIAYYLLLLYIVAMFKPVIPLLNDALAHTFNEAVHINTVHLIYGEHHAEAEAKSSNAADKKNTTASEKFESAYSVHIPYEQTNPILFSASISCWYNEFLQQAIYPVYLSLPAPPPNFG